eukprot:9896849-Heterocapsa_arctica.AAC.1
MGGYKKYGKGNMKKDFRAEGPENKVSRTGRENKDFRAGLENKVFRARGLENKMFKKRLKAGLCPAIWCPD